MNRPPRVLIAKIGLDGHDRGAKLIVRNLRDSGMEVIYTGLWQTAAATVHAALQEDVDVLGVSLLSAAHMTIMPELRRRCHAAGLPDLPIIVGGIIPEEDHAALRDAGVQGIFNPGTPLAAIIDAVRRLAQSYRSQRDAAELKPNLATAEGLASGVTLLTEGRPERIGPLPEPPAAPLIVGVTGAPGVGKSTCIGKLARGLRQRGHRVAVLAIDPTSPLTGGSVLGDRLRIVSGDPDEGLFVRSLSSSGEIGGLAPHCSEIARLCAVAGYRIVIVETVGAGQSDTQIRGLTDHVLLVLMPGAGDDVQFAKAGIYEIAAGFVVNKSDLPGADTTVRQIRETIGDDRPVWPVSALRSEGFEPLCDWAAARLTD